MNEEIYDDPEVEELTSPERMRQLIYRNKQRIHKLITSAGGTRVIDPSERTTTVDKHQETTRIKTCRVWGLDLGQEMGFSCFAYDDCLHGTPGLMRCALFPLAAYTKWAGERIGAIVNGFWTVLNNELKSEVPDYIFFEEVRGKFSSSSAAHWYGAFWGALHHFGLNNDIPVHGLSVSRIKKVATDNGRASKQDMLVSAREKFQTHITNNNVADAVFTGYAGIKDIIYKET